MVENKDKTKILGKIKNSTSLGKRSAKAITPEEVNNLISSVCYNYASGNRRQSPQVAHCTIIRSHVGRLNLLKRGAHFLCGEISHKELWFPIHVQAFFTHQELSPSTRRKSCLKNGSHLGIKHSLSILAAIYKRFR